MWFISVEVEKETSAPPPKKKSWIRTCFRVNKSYFELMALYLHPRMAIIFDHIYEP